MIVKVQASMVSSDGAPSVLIYDEKRATMFETRDRALTGPVLKLLEGRPKAYFHATLDPKRKIVLGKEAPTQAW